MKQQGGIRLVTTAVMTAALTVAASGMALAQAQPEASWQRQGARATHALNMLEDQGFSQFTNFQADGQNFSADVVKHGHVMQVTINPDTKQILRGGTTPM
ncbi:MAG TPA: PepSY domain-containing protein [Rhodopila sp.]|jgi:hypothetical protein|nr:PepSY domain-containing protein [Rhodopila sp.]